MPVFTIRVVIENKPGISDPEGDTILRDLVARDGDSPVSGIRTAKMLVFTVRGEDGRSAEASIRAMCDEMRIYNPLVSVITVTSEAA